MIFAIYLLSNHQHCLVIISPFGNSKVSSPSFLCGRMWKRGCLRNALFADFVRFHEWSRHSIKEYVLAVVFEEPMQRRTCLGHVDVRSFEGI